MKTLTNQFHPIHTARLPNRVLGYKNPMDILSTFYPDLHTTDNIVPKIITHVSF